MLAYAPRPERRRLNPPALALIVGAHAIALFAVMSARMDLPVAWKPQRTDVTFVPLPPEPQPEPLPRTDPRPANRSLDAPRPIIDAVPLPGPITDSLPLPLDPGPLVGNGMDPLPLPKPQPIIRTGPRFATADADIRPPYPESKRALGQEAVLKLKLQIDERGRVTAVEPVGKADATFLAAARRHIIKAWRYRPAKDGDKAIASSTVITLQFELD